jgi:hypothetical protein
MRDSAVIIVGLLLIGGCGRIYVNSARNAAERKQDLADCTAKADQQPQSEASAWSLAWSPSLMSTATVESWTVAQMRNGSG